MRNKNRKIALLGPALALALGTASPAAAAGSAHAARPNLVASPEMAQALSVSSAGLVERTAEVPGGGVLLDLRGRFRSVVVGYARKGQPASVSCVEPGHAHDLKEASDARR